jgi:hypothetical protein
VLTNATTYWLTNTAAPSARFHYAPDLPIADLRPFFRALK